MSRLLRERCWSGRLGRFVRAGELGECGVEAGGRLGVVRVQRKRPPKGCSRLGPVLGLEEDGPKALMEPCVVGAQVNGLSVRVGGLGPTFQLRQGDSELRTRGVRSEEHTSELQSLAYLVCRLLLEK